MSGIPQIKRQKKKKKSYASPTCLLETATNADSSLLICSTYANTSIIGVHHLLRLCLAARLWKESRMPFTAPAFLIGVGSGCRVALALPKSCFMNSEIAPASAAFSACYARLVGQVDCSADDLQDSLLCFRKRLCLGCSPVT